MKKRITRWMAMMLFACIAFTNTAVFAQTTDTLLYEPFNYPTGQIPTGWTLDGAQAPWSVSNTNYGFGEAPELMLGYSFASGLSRLISTPIDITGHDMLKLKFRQYLINYEMDWGEVIGVDVTFDGGASWQTLWERPLGTLSIPPDMVEYYFSAPANATQVQYAFRYEGNNNAINMWLIDDLTLETVMQNELITSSFSGTMEPTVGAESLYTIEVLNAGSVTQSAYTVKLMKEGGIELASTAGQPIEFAQKLIYQLPWSPVAGEVGNSHIYGYIDFAQDENQANNQSIDMNVAVQPENVTTVEIGKEFIPCTFMPYNFFSLYSTTQTLYFPDEIGITGDSIIGLGYKAQFDQNTEGVHLQIMLGETTTENLMDAWIAPSTLTMVFDGLVTFRKGLNEVYIPLDTPYKYNGQNLVVQSVKGFGSQLFLTPVICSLDSTSARSRAAERDDQPFDPMVVPEWGYSLDLYPNVKMFFAADPTGIETISSANISIYPNPASSQLHIESDETMLSVRIINTMGQEVYAQPAGTKHLQVNVGTLKQGMYIVQMVTKSGTSVQKVQIGK